MQIKQNLKTNTKIALCAQLSRQKALRDIHIQTRGNEKKNSYEIKIEALKKNNKP